jgi:hypothetical protein
MLAPVLEERQISAHVHTWLEMENSQEMYGSKHCTGTPREEETAAIALEHLAHCI